MKYKFRTRPYLHQVQGIRFAMSQFRKGLGVALLFEPRTGKTKTTIDTISILHMKHGVRRVVVIAPNRVLGTWVTEIHTHCPLTVQTIVWDKKARKQALPTDLGAYDLQCLIVNYEAFGVPGRRTASGRRSKATGRFKHRKLIDRWLDGDPHAVCVVDEGHKLKSPSGKASNMIVSMRPMFKYRFLLTGTPITKAKRAADAYMEWQWVNPRRFAQWGSTFADFRNHTGRWIGHNGFPQWVGARPRGMQDLRKGMHADGMVVLRDECLDLPARLPDRVIDVPLTTSAKHYDEMAEHMMTRLTNGEIAEASIPLVVTLRLTQITSGFVGIRKPHPTDPDKMISVPRRVGTEKLKVLKELLVEEAVERDEKLVIAARFVHDLNAIERLCKHMGMVVWSIRGRMPRTASDDALRAFRVHNDGPAVMVVQPQAASLGIDLSTASHLIWYSLTSSWVDFTQVEDRIALSKRGTLFTYLLAPGVDKLLYATLQQDGDVSKAILRRPDALLRRG